MTDETVPVVPSTPPGKGANDVRGLGIFLGGLGWLLTVVVGIVCLMMWGCPRYDVYKQDMAGQAKLKEAESSRQIAVQEAHAKREAAKDLAQAEVTRAGGVAEANKIIGEGLKNNHEYLMYLWVHAMADQGHQIIYVPTEGGLPIMEAGRFQQMAADKAARDARAAEEAKKKEKP